MNLAIRITSALFGVALLTLATGFLLQQPWATRTWPWEDSRLTYIFIASILAAIATPVTWIGMTGEWAAVAGGALNLAITFGGSAWVMLKVHRRDGDPKLRAYAVGFALLSLYNVGLLIWSARRRTIDRRRLPHLVRASFVMFAITLIVVGIMLLRRAPTIFPWPLNADTSMVIGFIFLGVSAYFTWASLKARWHDARGQLIGFLAYDLVLLPPYLAHFADVKPEHRHSLIVYITVLVYSVLLASYYLFLDRDTRNWTVQR